MLRNNSKLDFFDILNKEKFMKYFLNQRGLLQDEKIQNILKFLKPNNIKMKSIRI